MSNYWVFKNLPGNSPLIAALNLSSQDARMKALALLPKGVCLLRHGDYVVPVRAGAFHLDALVYAAFLRGFCMTYPGDAPSALAIDMGQGRGMVFLHELRMQSPPATFVWLHAVHTAFDTLYPADAKARATDSVSCGTSLTYASLLRKLSYPAGALLTFPRNARSTPATELLEKADVPLAPYIVNALRNAQAPDKTRDTFYQIDHISTLIDNLELVARSTCFATDDAARLDVLKALGDDMQGVLCTDYMSDSAIELLPQAMLAVRVVGFFLRTLCALYATPRGKRDAFVTSLLLDANKRGRLFARKDISESAGSAMSHAAYFLLRELGVNTDSDVLSALYKHSTDNKYEPLTALFTGYCMFVLSSLFSLYHYAAMVSSDNGARGVSMIMTALETGSGDELRTAVSTTLSSLLDSGSFEAIDAETGQHVEMPEDMNPFEDMLSELPALNIAQVTEIARGLVGSVRFPYSASGDGNDWSTRVTNILGLTAKAVGATSITMRHLFAGNHEIVSPSRLYAPQDVYRMFVIEEVVARNSEEEAIKPCVAFVNSLADLPREPSKQALPRNDQSYSPFAFKDRAALSQFLYPRDAIDPLLSMLNSL